MNKTRLFSAKLLIIICLSFLFVLAGVAIIVWRINYSSSSASNNFNRLLYSLKSADSIWVIVNKKNPLNPIHYAPTDLVTPSVPLRVPDNETMQLRAEAANALEQMFSSAQKSRLDLMLSSAYRSFNYQANLYDDYVKSQGQAEADRSSARPGFSEHQTGLAVDIEPVSRNCEVEPCFGGTVEAKWLNANAYRYGFILRYPKDKVSITGYEYEPWHFRYVGKYLATEMHTVGTGTLEEFFGIPGGVDY